MKNVGRFLGFTQDHEEALLALRRESVNDPVLDAPRDQLAARGEAFAHAYISNGPSGVPQKASGLRRAWAKLERLCSTHPSTDDRIAALRRADALAQKK